MLRSLRRLDHSTWADLTTRHPDGRRTWLDLPTLHPELALQKAPRVRVHSGVCPGETGTGLGGHLLYPERGELTTQRWTVTSSGLTRPHFLSRAGHPRLYITSRPAHRLLVTLARGQRTGTIPAELMDTHIPHVDRHHLTPPPEHLLLVDLHRRQLKGGTPDPRGGSLRDPRFPPGEWNLIPLRRPAALVLGYFGHSVQKSPYTPPPWGLGTGSGAYSHLRGSSPPAYSPTSWHRLLGLPQCREENHVTVVARPCLHGGRRGASHLQSQIPF